MIPWTTIRKGAAIGLAIVATAFLVPSALIAQETSSIEVTVDQNTTVVVNGEVVADGATVTVDGATVTVDGGNITVEQATDGGSVEVTSEKRSKGGKGGVSASSSSTVVSSSSSRSHSSQSVSVSSSGGASSSSSSSNVSVQVVSQNGETKVSINR
jgi:hypothetical protein